MKDRFFIVDPSLGDNRGHHFSLTKSISHSATKHGMDVYWLGAQECAAELVGQKEFVPTFGASMYASYMLKEGNEAAGERAFFQRVIQRVRSVVAGQKGPQQKSGDESNPKIQLLQGLVSASDTFSIDQRDRLLFHTADGATYMALAQWVSERDHSTVPHLHICTPYDPVRVMPNRDDPEDVESAIECFRDLGLLGHRVHLYAENAPLASHLSTIWGANVSALNLPAAEIGSGSIESARTFRAERIGASVEDVLVVTLGAARIEKGFHLIPDIIRRTFEFAGEGEFSSISAEKIRFALHASPQIIGRHPVISATLDKLEQLPDHQVYLLKEPLSDEDYRNLILAADFVLLPYDEEAYRFRGSGVVAEAIVASKLIIAKSGSYPAQMAEWQGGAVGETPLEMAKSLLNVLVDRAAQQKKADRAAKAYVSENSMSSYVEKLISSEVEGAA